MAFPESRTRSAQSEAPTGTPNRSIACDELIDRMRYFDQFGRVEADNDNATVRHSDAEDASCYRSWALPDYMRR